MNRQLRRAVAGATALGLLASTALASIPQSQPAEEAPRAVPAPREAPSAEQVAETEPERIPGELIPAELHGPSVIESMEQVLEREKLRPTEEPVNPKDRNGQHGVWTIPSRGSTYYPASGDHYAVNKFGDTRMGIGFGAEVDLEGAWIAAQGTRGVWTDGVRVVAYRDGVEVARTEWFEDIGEEPAWFAMELHAVDRVEFVARPVNAGAGFFALDDLTFVRPGKADQDGGEAKRVVIDFEDLSYRTALTGSGYGGLTWEQGTGDFVQPEPDVEAVQAPQEPPGFVEDAGTGEDEDGDGGFLGGAGTLPTLDLAFAGPKMGDSGSNTFPPDSCGAIGPNHYVAVVNSRMVIYDKVTGDQVFGTSLSSFFGGGGGDPRVVFDHHSDRWIVILDNFNTGVRLGVSLTDDPTGSWFKTFVTLSAGADAGNWPDYPTLGVDADGIYMAAYMVGGNFNMAVYALKKAPLIDANPSLGTVHAWRSIPYEGAVQPCVTYGNPGGEYLISRTNSTSLRVRRIDGPLSAPTLTQVGFVTTPNSPAPPNGAPAMGSTVNLDTVSSRLMNAVYRNGSIWTAGAITRAGRAAARWFEVDPLTLTALQTGTVKDDVMHFFIPSISVNAGGDAVLGFTASSPDMFASTYYTGRVASDPPGEMAVPVSFKDGTGAYNHVDGVGRNRWGDYSLCSVDPTDQTTIWTIQEYARLANRWGTRIGKLTFEGDVTLGTTFCDPAVPNSTGSPGVMAVTWSEVVADDDLVLSATQLPTNSNIGYFIMGNGTNTFVPPGSTGPICVAPGIKRYLPPVNNTNEFPGGFSRDVGTMGPVSGNITAGSTWNFQAWHRDSAASTSNLTDAVSVTFQ